MIATKPLTWCGDSYEVLRGLSDDLQDDLGFMLHQVQAGLTPSNYRPMAGVGPGVYELRASDQDGIARAMYIAKYPEAVYVLHVFQKKAQKTPKSDMDKAADRLREINRERQK
ncbi:type II toxin-antitoxin system RelE/ParE family toxin [Mycolicibacterium sp.]|uniref:type II toxin-antitoxin system RelE/ParE family toxin n=1 Tax=Mycolicibacterium sp. TaxID=2320850 RepID=UPI0037C8C6F2